MTREQGDVAPQMEQEFRLFLDSMEDCTAFLLDPLGRGATWNRSAERIEGYRADEIIGHHFSRFYQQKDVDAGKPFEELRIAIETGRFEEEGWRVRKDGTLFWANVLIVALRGPAGEFRGFGKLTRDLSEKKSAEERLRESEEHFRKLSRRLEMILDGVGDGITVDDRSGRLVFANRAAARTTRFASPRALVEASRSGVLDKFDIFDAEGRPFDPAKLPATLALEGIETEPLLFRARNRATAPERWIRVHAKTIRDERGQPELTVNIWRDVTDRRREEMSARSLASANEALSRSFDYEQALTELAKSLVPELADGCGVDIVEDGRLRSVAIANADPAKIELGREVRLQHPELVEASAIGEVRIDGGGDEVTLSIRDRARTRPVDRARDRPGARRIGALRERAGQRVHLRRRASRLGGKAPGGRAKLIRRPAN